jgi:hypothetical protein
MAGPFLLYGRYLPFPLALIVTLALLLGADTFFAASNAATVYVSGVPEATAESIQLVDVVVANTVRFFVF